MNFDEQKEYIKNNKKIDISKFDRISEVTNMIDFLNAEKKEKADKRAEEDIHSISQFLEAIEKRKTFILKKGR